LLEISKETKDFAEGDVCPECGKNPCVCKNAKEDVCPKCGNMPCTCEEDFAKEKKVEEEMACGDKDKMSADEVCPECGNNPCTCEEEPKEEMACGDKKEYTINFSLSHEDIRNELYNKLWDMGSIENTCYAIIETHDNYFKYCVDFELFDSKEKQLLEITGEVN
jgi:hypothetical protein